MTARREARVRESPPRVPRAKARAARLTSTGVPQALAVGPLVEVWAEGEPPEGWGFGNAFHGVISAAGRWSAARRAWLKAQGIGDRREGCEAIPYQAPWTLGGLSHAGQAEAIGRPVAEIVAERLRAAGCTRLDLPALREQADQLARRSHVIPTMNRK